MNARDFKKQIRHSCGEIALQCIIAANTIPGIDIAKLDQAVVETARLQALMLSHTNVAFDKVPKDFADKSAYAKSRRTYYKQVYDKLEKEFLEGLKNIVADMNAALPAVKE